ncbi:MAG: tyrosine-type recombinase/integrase [Myxococcales bacterium]|nr:tyrosine-type recombinase/integrase [Myxococcales bacterium]
MRACAGASAAALKPARRPSASWRGWNEATRHTFASQWVLAGGSIEKLKEILGHYSVVVTERYTHLRPDLFADRELGAIAVDLRAGAPDPVRLGAKTETEEASPLRKAR